MAKTRSLYARVCLYINTEHVDLAYVFSIFFIEISDSEIKWMMVCENVAAEYDL